MMQNQSPFASPSRLGVQPAAQLSAAFLTQSFAWMFAGLMLTAVVAWYVQGSAALQQLAADFLFPAIILQLGIVIGISFLITRINATVALGLFFIYAATVGLTVGLIVSAYSMGSVATAFLSASAMFGAAAIYGATTKRSLASIGGFLFMGLIGLIVAMVLNLFIGGEGFSFIISIGGVILFTALTAYHVQRIQNGELAAMTGSMEKAAVLGALMLYLSFINLFLFFLRLFGSSRS